MIYGYIRVSTDKQTLENQRHIILNYCEVNGFHIDGWIEETISGTKAPAIAGASSFTQSVRSTYSSSALRCADIRSAFSRSSSSMVSVMA